MNEIIQEDLEVIYRALGFDILGDALCSPDYETGKLEVNPWQDETERTIMWPVYLANCACDSEVFDKQHTNCALGHYVYCLEPMPNPLKDCHVMYELQQKFRVNLAHIGNIDEWEGWMNNDGVVISVNGKTINEAITRVVLEYLKNNT